MALICIFIAFTLFTACSSSIPEEESEEESYEAEIIQESEEENQDAEPDDTVLAALEEEVVVDPLRDHGRQLRVTVPGREATRRIWNFGRISDDLSKLYALVLDEPIGTVLEFTDLTRIEISVPYANVIVRTGDSNSVIIKYDAWMEEYYGYTLDGNGVFSLFFDAWFVGDEDAVAELGNFSWNVIEDPDAEEQMFLNIGWFAVYMEHKGLEPIQTIEVLIPKNFPGEIAVSMAHGETDIREVSVLGDVTVDHVLAFRHGNTYIKDSSFEGVVDVNIAGNIFISNVNTTARFQLWSFGGDIIEVTDAIVGRMVSIGAREADIHVSNLRASGILSIRMQASNHERERDIIIANGTFLDGAYLEIVGEGNLHASDSIFEGDAIATIRGDAVLENNIFIGGTRSSVSVVTGVISLLDSSFDNMRLWVGNSHANVRLPESAEAFHISVSTELADGFLYNGVVTEHDALRNDNAEKRLNFTSFSGTLNLYD
jgi:hypothetical protein